MIRVDDITTPMEIVTYQNSPAKSRDDETSGCGPKRF
jgi:hypothetical protein